MRTLRREPASIFVRWPQAGSLTSTPTPKGINRITCGDDHLPSRRSPISLNAQPSPASAHDTSLSASALILRRFLTVKPAGVGGCPSLLADENASRNGPPARAGCGG